jgi:hypothetical protein
MTTFQRYLLSPSSGKLEHSVQKVKIEDRHKLNRTSGEKGREEGLKCGRTERKPVGKEGITAWLAW